MAKRSVGRAVAAGAAGLMVLWGGVFQAAGQIVGPVPPATPPTPPYTPPPPPPPPQPAPAADPHAAPQPEERLPTIVRKNREGKMVPVRDRSPEEAAFRAFAYSKEQWEKMDAVIEAREREIDKFVVEHVPEVMEASRQSYRMNEVTEFGHLPPIRDLGLKLSQGSLVDRLIRDGALPFEQKRKIDAVVKEYNDALRAHWEKEEFNNDPLKVALQIGKEAFLNNVRDVIAALDRSVRHAAPKFGDYARGVGLTPEQQAALARTESEVAAIPGAEMQDQMRRLGHMKLFFLEVLTVEQQENFLRAVEAARAAAEAEKK